MLRHALGAAAFLQEDDAADHQDRHRRGPAHELRYPPRQAVARRRPGKDRDEREDQDEQGPPRVLGILLQRPARLVARLNQGDDVVGAKFRPAHLVIELRCRSRNRQNQRPEQAHEPVRLHRGQKQAHQRCAPDGQVDDQVDDAALLDQQVDARNEADRGCKDHRGEGEERDRPAHRPARAFEGFAGFAIGIDVERAHVQSSNMPVEGGATRIPTNVYLNRVAPMPEIYFPVTLIGMVSRSFRLAANRPHARPDNR